MKDFWKLVNIWQSQLRVEVYLGTHWHCVDNWLHSKRFLIDWLINEVIDTVRSCEYRDIDCRWTVWFQSESVSADDNIKYELSLYGDVDFTQPLNCFLAAVHDKQTLYVKASAVYHTGCDYSRNIVIICTNCHFVNFVKAKCNAWSLRIGSSGLYVQGQMSLPKNGATSSRQLTGSSSVLNRDGLISPESIVWPT